MTSQERRPHQSARAPAIVTVATLTAIVLVSYAVRQILLPFVLSGIIAFLCSPLLEWLTARTAAPRWAFAWLLLLALMTCAATIGWLAIPPLLREIGSVGDHLQGTLESLLHGLFGNRAFTVLDVPMDPGRLASAATAELHGWTRGGHIVTLAVLSFGGLFGFILSWVLLAYFLLDARRITAGLLWIVPPADRPFALRVWDELGPVLRRYFTGVLLVVTYAAGAAYLGLGWILGLHHAVFLALLTGVLETIPIVGPATAAVVAGLIAVREASSPWNIVGYIVYAIALRVSIDQIVGPLILGRAGRLHPALIIFCFLAGGVLLGVTGVILAVPVALAIKVILAIHHADPDRAV